MAEPALAINPVRRIGRYDLHEEIASGGMATVYLGRLVGTTGFSRPVAIKRLHDNLATDPKFVSMLLDEARLAARVRHPNVVATLDVVEADREVVVVMEYVHGESLAVVRKIVSDGGERVPPRIAATIIAGALHGLHAAHEAVDEQGDPLGIVHRDVSPQNILIGVDGVARVLDFGIAKAAGRMQTTQDGKLKGKFGYMAPEQLKGGEVTRQADVYAAAVVFWETLTGRRLYAEDEDAASILTQILFHGIAPPSTLVPGLSPAMDAAVMHGLEKEPEQRYANALEMAIAVEQAFGLASATEVGAYVKDVAHELIRQKAESLAVVERADTDAGQKQRREVVARVATRQSEYPPAPSRSKVGLWIGAILIAAFGGSFGVVRVLTQRQAMPVTSTQVNGGESTLPTGSARASGGSTAGAATSAPTQSASTGAPPPVGALDAAAPDASFNALAVTSAIKPVKKITSSGTGGTGGTGAKKPVGQQPDNDPPTTTVVTPPVTPETPSEDAGRDLIPKLRK